MYHGFERRGTKSVSLLSTSEPPASFKNEDPKIYEMRNRNYEIPDKGTTYLCTGFQMPDLGGKHHMTEFEVVYTPGNENYVHHVIVQRCNGTGYPHLDMATAECQGYWPKGWPNCPEIVAVWATGGGPFYFPEEAGYPVGGPDDLSFYVLQTHYNNPMHKSGVLDSSGIRFKLTSKLRQYDITAINIGVSVNDHQVIPPHEKAFISRGYGAADCFAKAMNETGITEAKIIGAFQHAHLLGVGITTRHVRNGVELPVLMYDPHYDFFVQDTRPVKPARTVKPGDSFIVECTYDSMGRTGPSFGGFSTREEMCLTAVYVYPKFPLMSASSMVKFDTYNSLNITSDRELHDHFLHMDWTDHQMKQDFYDRLGNSTVQHHCVNRVKGGGANVNVIDFKENVTPFVPEDPLKDCPKSNH